MKKILALLMIIACLVSTSAMARTLTASVNRPEIPQGEVVVLTLEYLGAHTDKTPDLSVLKKDFNIFSMEQEFQNIYDNGKTYQLQKWNIGLMPKGVGKILIPAVSLDGNRSQALEINVIPAGDASAIKAGEENMPKYAISAEIDNTSPYVQQEINMTVSIFDAGGLQGSAPYFDSEAQNDWNILGLGEPTLESKVINGQSVRVIKFKYALFPQKSGTLKLPQARFDGYYLTGRRRSNPLQQLIDSQFGDIGLSISLSDRPPLIRNGGFRRKNLRFTANGSLPRRLSKSARLSAAISASKLSAWLTNNCQLCLLTVRKVLSSIRKNRSAKTELKMEKSLPSKISKTFIFPAKPEKP